MVKFGAGVLFGAACVLAFLAFGPKGTEAKARAAGQTAVEKAEDARVSYCQREFLEETQCFQNLPAAQCVSLIKAKCGQLSTDPDAGAR